MLAPRQNYKLLTSLLNSEELSVCLHLLFVFAMLYLSLTCLLLLCGACVVSGTEITFELPDNDKQCFYEELEKDVKFDIDFQVSSSESSITSVCALSRCCQTNF